MKKSIFCFILIFAILFSVPSSAYEVTGFEVKSANALLASFDTDEILYSKNIDERVFPASITKIMTAAVILDAVPDLNDYTVTMTNTAYTKILGTGSSVLNAKVGEIFTGKDALASILISSAGDVVYAFAEAISGDVDAFTDKMNEKAAELGLTGTHYQNPIGLHDENNYTTVRDIYTLYKYVLKNYPVFKELTSKSRYTVAATNLSSSRILSTTNLMIDPNTVYFYSYATSGKTGFTDESGRCLASTAEYDGYTYICITMNCPTEKGVRNEFVTSKSLYRWAFNNFKYKSVLDISAPVCEIKVRESMSADYVSLYPEKQLTAILPKDADESTLIINPCLVSGSVRAPVHKGDILGTADVIYAEQVIGTVNLVAGNDLKRSAVLAVLAFFKSVFTSGVFKVILILAVIFVIGFILYTVYINRKKKRRGRKVKYVPLKKEETKRSKKTERIDSVSPPDPSGDDYFNI